MGVLGGKLYVLANPQWEVVSLTQSSASPRRLPELEDFPHDAVVPELAQEDNRPIGGCAFFDVPRGVRGYPGFYRVDVALECLLAYVMIKDHSAYPAAGFSPIRMAL